MSCGENITITEYELINDMEIQRFIRTNQYSGTITVMYNDEITTKSIRKYVSGKKNGVHEGWWPNGTKKYSFVFKDDTSTGKHFQWHQNGKLFTQKQFKNGLEQGEQKAWVQ
jgi:antitoxin component YwqK of YwqJK toxin-antitoxin module